MIKIFEKYIELAEANLNVAFSRHSPFTKCTIKDQKTNIISWKSKPHIHSHSFTICGQKSLVNDIPWKYVNLNGQITVFEALHQRADSTTILFLCNYSQQIPFDASQWKGPGGNCLRMSKIELISI